MNGFTWKCLPIYRPRQIGFSQFSYRQRIHTFRIDKTQNGNHNKRTRQQLDVSNDDGDDDIDLSENSMFTFHFHLIRGASIYFAGKCDRR